MTKFFKSGNSYRLAPGDSVDVRDSLPAGNYAVKFHPMQGFWLETAEEFKMPPKIYGDCIKNCERVLNTFSQRARNTGVMLVGEKGSGKTLLARQIAISSGMPVLIINDEYSGEDFNSFLSAVTQPAVVMFDEFEKVYSREKQEKILTLLDGTYQSEKLFLLTSNDKWKLDTNMKNRPGRIFYLFEFDGLSGEFIRQYCGDRLEDQSKVEEVVKVASLFDKFNFDLLTSFVEEINRYGDSPTELVKILNAKPEYSGRTPYVYSVRIGEHDIPPSALADRDVTINPNVDEFRTCVFFTWKRSVDEEMRGVISEAIGSGDPDIETLTEWLNEGKVVPGRRPPSEWRDEKVSTDYIYIPCAPEEISRYEGVNTVVYKTEGGYEVRLTKSPNRKKRRPSSSND